ncbi:MAG: hypothetical protein DI551_02870 [Micavibrio aeruginosavorus]|uniref:Uncharacterized protein n=1 Tax=Micavibrio aeruginosavorus TaxID=349221 RepID=A0A2W5N2N6_9BACT|nr:MAG: hypothetical protein DI551_02870 [Micavibrio aeruginosavorus]
MGLLLGIMFWAVAILLIVGMIPTIVAAIVDRTKGKVRTLTIGAINFAGCAPFALEIFKRGNDLHTAISYVVQPRTIVVMYLAAGVGYMIDWAMTGIVSSIMVQRAKGRTKEIKKQQAQLIERWGVEVTGTIPLDEYGFPKEEIPAKGHDQSSS